MKMLDQYTLNEVMRVLAMVEVDERQRMGKEYNTECIAVCRDAVRDMMDGVGVYVE